MEESCERCSRRVVTHWSTAAGARVCERCHFAASPPPDARTRAAVLAYKPPSPPPAPKPTRRALLTQRVIAALERAGEEAHGGKQNVFGLGDPRMPLLGYCPSCRQGTVAVRMIDADPPAYDVDECSMGCTPEQIARAIK